MREFGRHREVPSERNEQKETGPTSFDALRERASGLFSDILKRIGGDTLVEGVDSVKAELVEAGVEAEDIHFSVVNVEGIGSVGEVRLVDGDSSPSAKERVVSPKKSMTHSVALAGLLLMGCGKSTNKAPTPQATEQRPAVTDASTPGVRTRVEGDPRLGGQQYGAAEQPTPAPGEDHVRSDGPLTPKNAPTGYGVHQWRGYSEYNPVAVAWLAIKNTGKEACQVKVTRLEISYKLDSDEVVQGGTGINGAQLLSDGTQGEGDHWGRFMGNLGSGSTFTIPPNTPDYVHPFGPMVEIPENATQVTATFAAEITAGCIVGGGMDTYSEYGTPRVDGYYTQDGSPTDFIKEGLKMPWIGETVPPEKPMSYAIVHKNPHERGEHQR